MKKATVWVIIFCMLCFSISGAVSSQNVKKENENNNIEEEVLTLDEEHHISTEQATNQIASTAEKYFALNVKQFT